jgi:hypothetical protein
MTALQLASAAAPRKHIVILGATRKVAYSKADDPAGAAPGETELKVRALMVDGVLKEWTTGEAHDVTDRSFVVRRVIKINDALPEENASTGDKTAAGEKCAPSAKNPPSEKPEDSKMATAGSKPASGDKATAGVKPASARAASTAAAASTWVWQRGAWLLVDRVTGHIVQLKLPDYDPGVSQVVWFRDYAAYCGVTPSGKSLYAVVAQVAARKAVVSKKLSAFDAENYPSPVCGLPEWQREPLRVIFHPTGKDAVSFEVVPGAAAPAKGEAKQETETKE